MGSAAVLSRALGPQLMAQALGWKRQLPGAVQQQLWCRMQVGRGCGEWLPSWSLPPLLRAVMLLHLWVIHRRPLLKCRARRASQDMGTPCCWAAQLSGQGLSTHSMLAHGGRVDSTTPPHRQQACLLTMHRTWLQVVQGKGLRCASVEQMPHFPLQAQGVPADVLVMLVLEEAGQEGQQGPAGAADLADEATGTCLAAPTPQPSPFFPMQLHLVRDCTCSLVASYCSFQGCADCWASSVGGRSAAAACELW